MVEFLETRRSDSFARLSRLREDLATRLSEVDPPDSEPGLCIYATGSLARLEANPASDLDAFFFLTGSANDKCLSRIRDVKILNSVIVASKEADFPDFSNDGEYLKFLHINDVVEHIGGREDDYHNALTARMLLLLESKYIYNESLFDEFRYQVINRYFTDFHSHNEDFKPIFLLNDVLRFWRTLCLNYENGREWRSADEEKRAKGHLSNLKLRFSRLNICFSFIALLMSFGPAVSQDNVMEVCRTTPLDRLRAISTKSPNLAPNIEGLLAEYAWFLEAVGKPKAEVLSWISDRSNRDVAFSHGRKFVSNMYSVVHHIAEENKYLRYLVI
ncbi:hypothetical protein [Sphingopyxis sp. JAI108]|uniref:hypothetical protein n=1 Tax=Sphingopyxis sp. JAI108 TaxID=2723060 RepID=UPI0015CA5FDC|nr:hypothetical protein [Sphingopyxis sp. JAI108]NYF33284.1 hypothetical protein [Sphingopyxis sp. JAI108]